MTIKNIISWLFVDALHLMFSLSCAYWVYSLSQKMFIKQEHAKNEAILKLSNKYAVSLETIDFIQQTYRSFGRVTRSKLLNSIKLKNTIAKTVMTKATQVLNQHDLFLSNVSNALKNPEFIASLENSGLIFVRTDFLPIDSFELINMYRWGQKLKEKEMKTLIESRVASENLIMAVDLKKDGISPIPLEICQAIVNAHDFFKRKLNTLNLVAVYENGSLFDNDCNNVTIFPKMYAIKNLQYRKISTQLVHFLEKSGHARAYLFDNVRGIGYDNLINLIELDIIPSIKIFTTNLIKNQQFTVNIDPNNVSFSRKEIDMIVDNGLDYVFGIHPELKESKGTSLSKLMQMLLTTAKFRLILKQKLLKKNLILVLPKIYNIQNVAIISNVMFTKVDQGKPVNIMACVNSVGYLLIDYTIKKGLPDIIDCQIITVCRTPCLTDKFQKKTTQNIIYISNEIKPRPIAKVLNPCSNNDLMLTKTELNFIKNNKLAFQYFWNNFSISFEKEMCFLSHCHVHKGSVFKSNIDSIFTKFNNCVKNTLIVHSSKNYHFDSNSLISLVQLNKESFKNSPGLRTKLQYFLKSLKSNKFIFSNCRDYFVDDPEKCDWNEVNLYEFEISQIQNLEQVLRKKSHEFWKSFLKTNHHEIVKSTPMELQNFLQLLHSIDPLDCINDVVLCALKKYNIIIKFDGRCKFQNNVITCNKPMETESVWTKIKKHLKF